MRGHSWAKHLCQLCPRTAQNHGGTSPWLGSHVSAYNYAWSVPPARACAPKTKLPGQDYPRSLLSQRSFAAREVPKERRKKLSACCSPARGQKWAPAQPCPMGMATEAGRRLLVQERGSGHPCRGTWHRHSPEGDHTGVTRPGEDKQLGVAAALLLLRHIPSLALPSAQHVELVKGQAELGPVGAAMSAERRVRQ